MQKKCVLTNFKTRCQFDYIFALLHAICKNLAILRHHFYNDIALQYCKIYAALASNLVCILDRQKAKVDLKKTNVVSENAHKIFDATKATKDVIRQWTNLLVMHYPCPRYSIISTFSPTRKSGTSFTWSNIGFSTVVTPLAIPAEISCSFSNKVS